MIRLYIFLVICIICLSCENNNILDFTPRKTQVAIQPFGQFPNDVLKEVQAGIDSIYDIESTVLQPIDLPKQAYYRPRNRYRADSLIRHLKRIKSKEYDKILGVTTSDISTTKGGYKDFGIMGLGFRPGKSCVGSIYRVQRGTINRKHLISRFRKVTIHELGHNFGLKHCTFDSKCLMQSAKGKATTIDKADEILCENCRQQIKHVLR
ncbi:MAG: zinc-dependent metalloprotease family protein [Saprospiraceae bacterium]